MAGTGDATRRGRREAGLDTSLPAHRVGFASRVRDLHGEILDAGVCWAAV